MRTAQHLLSCLLLFGLLGACGFLSENDMPDDDSSTPTLEAPQVTSFRAEVLSDANKRNVAALSWEVSGTDLKLSVSPEPGTVTGTSVTVPLSETTTFTLTATNRTGTSSRSVTASLDDTPVPPGEPGLPDDPSPDEEPLELTGIWRLTAPLEIHNSCPLDWLFELSQVENQSGTVLTGSYDYGRDDPNASDPLLTCSGNPDGIFNPVLEGKVSDDGKVTLAGDYIYGADYTGAPPEDEDRITLEATATGPDTLEVNLQIISPGGGSSPFSTTATMTRTDTEPEAPAD